MWFAIVFLLGLLAGIALNAFLSAPLTSWHGDDRETPQ
jgi:hypothetical protein